MRWTHNDSAAFDATMKAGEKIRQMWDQYQAGQAGDAASRVTATGLMAPVTDTDRVNIDSYNQNIADQDNAMFGTENTGADYQYGPQDQKQVGKTYTMGGQTYGVEPTKAEQRAARLAGMSDYYYGKGDAEKGLELETKGLQQQVMRQNLRHGEQQIEEGGLRIGDMRRTQRKNEEADVGNKEIANLMERAHDLEAGTPEHQAVMDQINRKFTAIHGPEKGIAMATSQYTLSRAKRDDAIREREDKLFQASRDPQAMVDYYNKEFKDGKTARLVDGPNGTKQIVQYGDDGKPLKTLLSFKDWAKEGRPAILNQVTSFAKDAYKLDLQHRNKLEEIKAQGNEHVRYATALRADRDVKMTPEQKSALAEASKEVQAASDPNNYDEKKFAAARHKFNSIVREIGVANKNFGLIPDDRAAAAGKGPSEMTPTEKMKAREMALAELADDPGYKQLKTPEAKKAALVEKIDEILGGGVQRVKGVGTGANAPAAGSEVANFAKLLPQPGSGLQARPATGAAPAAPSAPITQFERIGPRGPMLDTAAYTQARNTLIQQAATDPQARALINRYGAIGIPPAALQEWVLSKSQAVPY